MPRDLFGDVTDPSIKVGSRKWYTVPLSLAAHTLVTLTLIIAPLLATGALPLPSSSVVFLPVVASPVPPAPPVKRAGHPTKVARNPNLAPVTEPASIERETGLEPGFEEGVDGVTGIEEIGVVAGNEALSEPPPPRPQTSATVRAGGDIKPPQKIHDVAPIYPTIAQIARIEGMVILEATIDVDGRVQHARILRSAPLQLLDEAALTAVRQWVYTPTRLNGQPVSVVMTVTVRFRLK